MLYYKIAYWWGWSLVLYFIWEDNYHQSISVDAESWWLLLISKLMSNGIGHVAWFWSWDLISWVWFSFKHKMLFAFHLIKYFTRLNFKQLGLEQRRNARYRGILQTIFWWRKVFEIHNQTHSFKFRVSMENALFLPYVTYMWEGCCHDVQNHVEILFQI